MSLFDTLRKMILAAQSDSSEQLYSALIEVDGNTLLAIDRFSPGLYFMNESTPDTYYIPDVRDTDTVRKIVAGGPRQYPEWAWDMTTHSFERRKPNAPDTLRDRAELTSKKVTAIAQIAYRTNRSRRMVHSGLALQETIYAEKEREARALKAAHFDTAVTGPTPFVSQFAEDSGISLEQAAEEILLRAQLDRDHLARSERLRMDAYRKIRAATNVEDIDPIVQAL